MEKAQHTVNGGGVRVKRVPANTLKSAFLRQRRGGGCAQRYKLVPAEAAYETPSGK